MDSIRVARQLDTSPLCVIGLVRLISSLMHSAATTSMNDWLIVIELQVQLLHPNYYPFQRRGLMAITKNSYRVIMNSLYRKRIKVY